MKTNEGYEDDKNENNDETWCANLGADYHADEKPERAAAAKTQEVSQLPATSDCPPLFNQQPASQPGYTIL